MEEEEDLLATKDMLSQVLTKMALKEVFVFQEVLIVTLIETATEVDTKMSQTSTDVTLVIAFLSTVRSPRTARTRTCSVLDRTTLHSARRAASHLEDQASAFSLGTTTETSNIIATTKSEEARKYWVDD